MKGISNITRRALRMPFRLMELSLTSLPSFSFVKETRETQTPITFEMWFRQQILGVNYGPYWPVHPSSLVTSWRNIFAGVETSPGYMPGCYIQGIGKVYIGDYTQIAPNVGIISANHDPVDLRKHVPQSVNIGRYCWLGMGSIILPGVTLGDFTIVGAGSIVTRSFPKGHCVIAGNPAREIRKLNSSECLEHKSIYEYHGFIPKSDFQAYRESNLNI